MILKSRWFWLTLLIVGSFYVWSLFKKQTDTTPVIVSAEDTVADTMADATSEAPPPPADSSSPSSPTSHSSPKNTESLQKKIVSFPKDISINYKNQVAADPHATPPIVLQAATQIFAISRSVQNEGDAKTAFSFFSKCVQAGDDAVVAVQTACYRQARTLAKQYPALTDDFTNLAQNTPENVLRIVQMDAME